MAKSNTKTKKTIGFSQEELAIVEAYRSITGDEFSPAVVDLVLKGLENHNAAKSLQKKVDYSINKLVERNHKFENRIANLVVGLARIQGKIHALTVVSGVRNSTFTKDELKGIENNGIQKAMLELKNNVNDLINSLEGIDEE
jgi:histone acetyltransferase (RNA polymerase elongator complex component)